MKTYIYLLLSALLLCAAFSCKKDPQGGDQENPSSQPGYPPATQVYSIKLSKTYAIVYSADYQLTATVDPADVPVVWSSSDEAVATVDSDGWVHTHSAGSVIITARAGDKNAICQLVVCFNLSREGTANCYVVPKSGMYYFKAAKGNSNEGMSGVSKAEVLWESFGTATSPQNGDVIQMVAYSDYETVPNNCICFMIPSPLKEGNAVIAAKDSGGNILWSWHIWVCKDFDPAASAQDYRNYYGTTTYGTVMDRNLGALSATPGEVSSLGLFYQWGRKDPFPGFSSFSQNESAKTTISWPSPVAAGSGGTGTIDYAVQHPTTFLAADMDWYYTTSSIKENTRWQASKGLYDPCPPGWQVPAGGDDGIWIKASGVRFFDHAFDFAKNGMDLSDKFHTTGACWYPAAGYKSSYGVMYNVGQYGYYWTATPVSSDSYRVYYLSLQGENGKVTFNEGFTSRAAALSVRCVK